jgi:hypothetical protein
MSTNANTGESKAVQKGCENFTGVGGVAPSESTDAKTKGIVLMGLGAVTVVVGTGFVIGAAWAVLDQQKRFGRNFADIQSQYCCLAALLVLFNIALGGCAAKIRRRLLSWLFYCVPVLSIMLLIYLCGLGTPIARHSPVFGCCLVGLLSAAIVEAGWRALFKGRQLYKGQEAASQKQPPQS